MGIMKATIVLMRQQRQFQLMLATMRAHRRVRETVLANLDDVVAAHVAAEGDVIFPAAAHLDDSVLAHHRALHARARLALEDLACATEAEFAQHLDALDGCLRAHALDGGIIVRALESSVKDVVLESLGEQMLAFRARRELAS
jgi:hypothetical protein